MRIGAKKMDGLNSKVEVMFIPYELVTLTPFLNNKVFSDLYYFKNREGFFEELG